MVVNFNTVRANIYTNIFNHLQSDATYAITTNNIHPSFNSQQLVTEGHPQVIVEEPTVSMQRMSLSPRTHIRHVNFLIEIKVYHNSSANAKTVADEISNSIIAGGMDLRADGLYELNFDEDSIEDIEHRENAVNHVYTLNLRGRFIADV